MKRALAVAVLVALRAGAVEAQSRFTLDLSGGAAQHQFARSGGAFSVAPELRLWRPNARLDLGLAYTHGASFAWNAEGGFDGAVGRPLGGNLSAQLGASGWWTAHRVGEGTGQLALSPTLRWEGRSTELTMNADVGHAATVNGGRWYGAVGGSLRKFLGAFDVQGRVQRTQFGHRTLRWGTGWDPVLQQPDTLVRIADTLNAISSYGDLGLSAGWTGAATRFTVGVEQRLGSREFRATAWHVEATRAMTPALALFASAGRTLSVLTAGLPARKYLVLGMRWAPGSRMIAPRVRSGPDGRGVRLTREPDASLRLLLSGPEATTVEVMGDFSDWEPVALQAAGDGWWALSRTLAPGLYRLNVRYNGGRWEVPKGLPTEADEFNGRVGVLLVTP